LTCEDHDLRDTLDLLTSEEIHAIRLAWETTAA
jgi:hypothetical protein